MKDWPLSYDELAPFYAEVERFIGVTGTADGLPQLPDGELLPPLPLNPFAQHFKSAVEARWHDRHVVALRRAVHGHDRVLAAALATGRVTLRPNAVVRRVLVDPGGKATGVAFVDRLSKNDEELRGRIVVLCASTIESTRILLNSGLASSSGVLGHYLMDHSFLSGVLRCKPPQVTPSDPTSASASRCYIPRFRAPRGYGIELAISTPNAEGTCDVEYGAIGEVVGAFENSVSVNEGQRDAWGIPTAHISYAYSGEDDAMVHDAAEAMRAMLEAAGFETLGGSTSRFAAGLSAHEMGTARMGSDPTTSVLDPWNRTWDCGNLFVTDAASFASGGCQNPTLTIMAMTVRACRYIVEQTKSGQL